MTAVPGTAKMEMRIDVLERAPTETAFHAVTAAGLGVWRTAAPGVKTYRYLKQVTNLAAPAYYRAADSLPLAEQQGQADQGRRTAHRALPADAAAGRRRGRRAKHRPKSA